MLTDPTTVGAWQGLEESVRTGEPQFAKEFGQEFFDYLAAQPHLSEQFNTAMSQNTRKIAGLVARHYDFGKHTTVLDIGGGDGTLLAEILRAHPSVKGVLLDLPEALTTAAETFAAADVLTRGSLEQGTSSPPFRPAGTCTCSRVCSTTGTTSSASPSSAAAGRRCPTTDGC